MPTKTNRLQRKAKAGLPSTVARLAGEVKGRGVTATNKAIARSGRRVAVEFERLAVGHWQRDTTPQEEAAILRAKREARAELIAKRFKDSVKPL